MNLLPWQVTVVACIAKLGLCIFLKSSPESIGALQTLEDKEYTVLCPSTNPRISIYLPHPEDCSQFYICENKIPYPKKCPKGLHFNNKLKLCDYPEIAGCDKNAEEKVKGRIGKEKFETCPQKNFKFPIYLADPEDCTRFFICDNGVPHSKKCFPGLHFNPKINACDYPKNAKCDTNADDNAKGRITDTDVGECPKENSIVPVYLPHPDDCNKFYICDNGSPILKKCLPRLHFNPKLNACDFPENAGCDKDVNDDNTKGRIADNDLGECPKENPLVPVYLPHPDDCNKFYICDNGSPILKKCLPRLHFNPKLNACDFPENAGCDKDAADNAKGRITDNDLGECPKENSLVPVYLPHPDDCNKFYICDNGSPILKKCLPRLHFNPKLNACDFPENAGCDKDVEDNAKGRIADNDGGECPKENSIVPVYLPHPDDCNKFYICDNGSPILKKCLPRLHFNPKLIACDFPENAGCDKDADDNAKGRITDTDVGECPKENSVVPVYLPHPDDCNKFYICDNGSPILKKCLPRLHFNPKLNACDFPENAGCDKETPRGKISDNSLDICQAEDSATPKFFPHPDDCNKFYICLEGSKFTQKCPGSLHFNPKFNYCDYPENAGCDTGESRILQGLPLDAAYFFSCPDSDTSTFHSHPTDCDKFYECNHGIPILKSCEPGLNFNEETHACDQAENTICEKETTLAFAGIRSEYCPLVDGKIPIFYRHPTNCSVYYMCAHGYAYKFVCPARLHFNLRRRLCDYEENAKCKI